MIPELEIKKAKNLNEALNQLSRGDLKPLAGGTDMIIKLRKQKEVDFDLLDISPLKELNIIREEGQKIFIGALTTFTKMLNCQLLRKKAPVLPLALENASCVQVRNRATVGGNICNASPSADSVPALVALDSEVHLKSVSGERNMPLDKFIEGPHKTDLRKEEILMGVSFYPSGKNSSCVFYKLGRREALAISRMNIAIILTGNKSAIEEAVISPGSVMPSPGRVKEAEEIVKGKRPSSELFERAARKTGEIMVEKSGIRWSSEYKKPVIQTMVKRALTEAAVNL